jgi:hypothetical protein
LKSDQQTKGDALRRAEVLNFAPCRSEVRCGSMLSKKGDFFDSIGQQET